MPRSPDAAESEPELATRVGTPADEAGSGSALYAEDLAVRYDGAEQLAVDVDRIDFPEGEITALVGPNGNGKSTLLKALSGHVDAERGVAVLDGKEVQAYDQKELARTLGLLSQENASPGSITVEDLVLHGRYPHRSPFESVTESDHAAVERAIDLAGIGDLRERDVGELSGGQKQLVWIAMTLAQETEVLLLDEPTTFLDLHHQMRVMEVVRTLNEESSVTVGVVLHDVAQAARFADYLIALEDGEVYDWGPPAEVVTEQLLAEVFGVDAAVSFSPDPRIVPRRSLE